MSSTTGECTHAVSDLALAAWLSAAGHRLQAIRQANGGRAVFVFVASPELATDTLRYYNREARVDPLTFAETMRNLKGAVRSG